MIELRVLGTLDLRDPDNGDLGSVLTRPKLIGLLVYLALTRSNGFRHRETLMGLFWPEMGQARARHALNQALYLLRGALGDGVVVSRGGEEVGLDPARLWCDAEAFGAALAAGDRGTALELYGGELLPGFALSESPELEAWLDERREGLRHKALMAVRERSTELARAGQRVEAAFWLRRGLRWEPYDEQLLRQLLEHLQALGDRTGALREYGTFARRLLEDLGVEPETQTRALADAIEAAREEEPLPLTPGSEPVTATVESPVVGTRTTRRSRGVWFMAGAAAVAALLALTSYRVIRHDEATVENGRVVIAELENRTGDPDLDPLGRMASDWIAQELLRTGLVQVVPLTAMLEETRRLKEAGTEGDDLLGALAASTGAGLVIHGSYARRADSLFFQVQILDVERGRLARAIQAIGSAEEPLTGVEELSGRTTGALATLVDDRLAEWADATSQPPSYEAYLAYTEGLDLHLEGELARGAEQFANAFRADTSFTAGLLWEAWSYQLLMYEDSENLEYEVGDRADSLVTRLRRRNDPLPPWDRAMLDFLIAERAGQRGRSQAALRRMVDLGPDPRFQVHYAWLAMARNYTREALAVIAEVSAEEAEARDLAGVRRGILAKGHHRLGEFERELELVHEWQRQDPAWSGLALELRANAGLGRTAAVDSLVRVILDAETDTQPQRRRNLGAHARELELHGYHELADSLRALGGQGYETIPPSERDEWWEMGEYRRLAESGRWAEARAGGERILATAPPSDNHIWFLGDLGVMAARAGDTVAARDYLERIETFDLEPIFTVDVEAVAAYQRMRILAVLGEKGRAIEVLRRAIAQDKAVFYHAHVETIFSELDALIGDPAYERLVAPRG